MTLPFTGGPDYGVPRYQSAAQQVDLGSIPNRLKGYSGIDGMGRVFLHDDFANGMLRWQTAKSGTGLIPALDTTASRVFVPPNALKFDASVAVNDTSSLFMFTFRRLTGRIGLETLWSWNVKTLQCTHELLVVTPPNLQKIGYLRYDPVANAFQVADAGGWHNVLSFDDSVFATLFYIPMKLVIDPAAGKYVRAIIGGEVVDLSAYFLLAAVVAQPYRFTVYIDVARTDAIETVDPPRLGYLTITYDEP